MLVRLPVTAESKKESYLFNWEAVMREFNNNGFALIEICIFMLGIVIAVSITAAAVQGYSHVERLKSISHEEEELKAIYAE